MTDHELLEVRYADFVGSNYAVSCNSGTSALHLGLLALGVGQGDEVIIPDFTMAACGFAVSYTGAKVVTVDCGEDFNINVSKIEEKITPKTKVIMAVHIYGRLADMDSILTIADKHGLYVLEDACEAQGAVYDSGADITCYSFYKNKIIAGEEGGMATTNDRYFANRMKFLKNMAFNKEHNYFHEEIGYNYRMPDSQARLILKSLDDYPKNKQNREKFELLWRNLIPTHKRDAVWVYDFLCESASDKELKIIELNSKNIPWRYFFKPLSTMPMWKQDVGRKALDYSNRGIYIQYHE